MFDFPNTPSNGQQVTGPGGVYQWDGAKWKVVTTAAPPPASTLPLIESGTGAIGTSLSYARADHVHPQYGGGGATLTISDTAPASPASGAMWFDSVGAQTYLWYSDPNSSQWVPVNAPPSSTTSYLPTAGGAMTGAITQPVAPVASTDVTNKAYVDAGDASALGNTGRNLLHNGLFTVQQRGTGSWTAAGYTADRWNLSVAAPTTASIGITTLNDSQRASIGDESAQFCLTATVTGNAAQACYMNQRIEGARRLAGKTVTVSFWCAASAALKVSVNLYQFVGSGGSPSGSAWGTSPVILNVTTSWARYSATFAVPSLSGKTLGTNGDDNHYLALFMNDTGAQSGNVGVQSGTFQFWGLQLEIGSGTGYPTPLAKRDPADELAVCQRFYFAGAPFWYGGYTSGSGQNIGGTVTWPTSMRAAPSVTFGSVTTSNTGAPGAYLPGVQGVSIVASSSAAGYASVQGNYTASADL